jgi:hypothetical protein
VVTLLRHAWQALLARSERPGSTLAQLIQDSEDDVRQKVGEAYTDIRRDVAGDAHRIGVLDAVSDQIDGYLSELALLYPDGLLDEVVQRLETAAEPDNGQLPGEQSLKDLLLALRDRLAAHGRRGSAAISAGEVAREAEHGSPVVPFNRRGQIGKQGRM